MNILNWWRIVKDTETATRSAELWLHNDERLNNEVLLLATKWIEENRTKDDVKLMLARALPNVMAHTEGFMEELTEMKPQDGLHEVDWEEVVEGLDEHIDELYEQLEVA